MFYDNFILMCNRINKSPSAAAVEMGFHRSETTRWSKGSTPRRANLQKMATYFGCTIEDLLADTKNTSATINDGDKQEYIAAWENATAAQRELALAALRLKVSPPEHQETQDS